MEAISDQIRALAATTDYKARRKFVNTLRQLLYEIESPEDTLGRLVYGHQQLAVARVAQKTKLIDLLAQNERRSVPIEEVVKETGMSPLLAERLLRYMAGMGMVSQVSDDSFAASNITKTLDIPGVRAAVGFGMDIVSPSAQALPAFLEQGSYTNPDNINDCPFHPGYNKEQNAMQFLFSHTAALDEFNTYMEHKWPYSKIWLDSYPIDISTSSPSDNFFVDIGGGVGQMCVALLERHPELLGRVILQDVAATIENLPCVEERRFEPMVHDYFAPQPVRDAKYYYFRSIMHNLTDESCRKVLTQTKEAMGPDSKILVDDIVIPSMGAHWYAVQLDLLMLSALGAMERTEEQWTQLFASVGLKINKIYVYDEVKGNTVLEVVADGK